ncbi:class I SAM-dependent methyltransferase [Porticoccaceae bacterium]|nr:class I SAM-dependent methyltransferase [Porticoccaceae bacterium]
MGKVLPLVCLCSARAVLKATAGKDGYLCTSPDCIHSTPDGEFKINNGIPVLISEDLCDTVCDSGGDQKYVERPFRRYGGLKKLIIGESNVTKENCKKFISELMSENIGPKVLIIGSGEQGSGTSELWNNSNIEIHGIDIYGSTTVDAICDAHYLPLESSYYDGVWIQAVLEHVVEPTVVVQEIFRVLKSKGIVYAETPFMQQVHEGAYDFTRYTVLGHRYLFRNFESICIGGNKGPSVVFAWCCRYLAWSLTRSRLFGRVVGTVVGILVRPLEYIVADKSLYDASSGVYFLGRKSSSKHLTHKDLVSLYRGQFN